MKPAAAPTTTVSTITAQPSATAGTESKPRRRRRWTPTEKAQYVALFAESRLRQSEFCRAMGVPAPSFSQWRRVPPLRRERAASAPHFAEVCVTEPSARAGAMPALAARRWCSTCPAA